MNSIDKFLRFIISVSIIFSIFAVSAFSQTQLIVEQDNAQVNELSDYYLSFTTTIGNYAKINKGQLVVTLPNGFAVEALDSVEVIDDYCKINYSVTKIEIDQQSIYLYLNRVKIINTFDDGALDDVYPSDLNCPINVTIRLSKIQNPIQTGDYQISFIGLQDNQKIAIGPLLSDPFTITTASVASITVTPSDDIILKAGTQQAFSASAFDQYGNEIEGVEFDWSLSFCSRYTSICIGELTGSSLYVTKTGSDNVQATAGEVTGYSGRIEVTPGELSSITVDGYDTQFVGNVILRGFVRLYDNFGNLKSDYDLEASPIEVISDHGELTNNILDDNNYQVNGVVKLENFNTTYNGSSGLVGLRAQNDNINTDSIFTMYFAFYFNNYDIIDLQDISNNSVVSLIEGEISTADILIRNNGNVKAEIVNISYYWQSRPDSITTLSLSPSNVEYIDKVAISLTPVLQVGEIDNLVISTESKFVNLGPAIFTTDEKIFPIEVLAKSEIQLVAESFEPDSIINKIPFDISFDVVTNGIAGEIDSTRLVVSVLDNINRQIIGDVYAGSPVYSSYDGNVIHYENIPAVLNTEQEFQSGWYPIALSHQLFTEGIGFSLTEPFVDSIYVNFDYSFAEISLIEGSLTPKIVYAGTNVSFEFKINIESSMPYVFHGALSQFKIFDELFSLSTNLFLETDSLYPGENTLRSASICIQPELVGRDLFAEAVVSFCLSGVDDTMTFVTNFTPASIPIKVLELPLVQILDLEVIAPNAPIVNSSQEIQFKATVANLSSNLLDSVQLELKTIDGASTITNPIVSALNIQPFDTAIVMFNVIAAPTSQSLPESFRVNLYDVSIGTAEPINNSAFLIIEDEAMLKFTYRVNGVENEDGLVVNQGDNIQLQLDLKNYGTAQVTNGRYQFIVSGITSNDPDTFTAFFSSDFTLDFGFVAPALDTKINFAFSVLEVPLDINYNAPAQMLNDSFEFSVLIVSNNADLVVEPVFLNSNLVLPGRSKEMFDLSITNTSNKILNSIQIDFINFNLLTPSHQSIEVRDVLDIGNSYFSEDGEKISRTTAGGDELIFWFTDFIIAPQQTRTISLVAEFKEISHKELLIELLQSKFNATYSDGPNIGKDVMVTSVSGEDEILSYHVVFKGSSLDESFIIENNPFNPTIEPVQFAYELTEDTPIEFQMFTLTGEEVFRAFYPAGTFGASTGENIITWDGRNNSGDMVLNGVYIASIINNLTGEYARIKVAVVK